ncbi:hypothetical protein [Halococcus thailandensis]|uniref:Uncharacterized protein n=1 Tax=Halococcus thailandensis JCM 13552 TaxID=1227457 RepID=M0N8Y9_9EURY|nr:hypothetical protein [Halococcus thailandensis]EMA53559.1 hypothetical protein C451_09740 [Halococcus thailandensis JCM 13552]
MSYDGAADTGRGVLHRRGRADARARRPRTAERTTGLAVAVLAVLTFGFAALWFAVSLPTLAWLFAASAVGFGALLTAPWLVVTGVVRLLERAQ